jgi:hypothetical protein
MFIFSHMQNTSIPYIFGLKSLCTNKRLELHRSKGYSFVQAFICVAKWWRMSHINVREYRRGNNNCSIQSNWQHRAQNTIYVGHHYTQTNTNNVNKTWAVLQTTRGTNERGIVFMLAFPWLAHDMYFYFPHWNPVTFVCILIMLRSKCYIFLLLGLEKSIL